MASFDDDWDDDGGFPSGKFQTFDAFSSGAGFSSKRTPNVNSTYQKKKQNGGGKIACHNCGGSGHIAKICPSPKSSENGQYQARNDYFQPKSRHNYEKSGNFRQNPNSSQSETEWTTGVFEYQVPWNEKHGRNGGYREQSIGGYREKNGYKERNGGFKDRNGYDRNGGWNERNGGFKGKNEGCYKCSQTDHFARECPEMQDSVPQEKYVPREIEESELFQNGISTGINFDKYEEVQVEVNGANPPAPISSFDECDLRGLIRENLKRAGYTKPTPVQKYAIPIVKENRDMMACAQTGSGKTAAFLLPMIHKLLQDSVEPHMGLPQTPEIIVISPTRELAIQITTEAKKFARGSHLGAFTVYGGTSVSYQRDKLREKNINIVVATPGRLLQFIRDETLSLKNLKFLVLDEADRMLEMGFRQDIDDVIKHPMMPPKFSRQTLMFSATFPDEIQTAAKTYLKEDYLFLGVGLIGGACADVSQSIFAVEAFDKRERLLEILEAMEKHQKTIVFVEKKQQADFLASFLSQNEFKATSIHGDRHQSQREEAVTDFVKGRMCILVATAVAARGLDIPNVAHVINYDLPNTIEEYVHRIGRTGRVGNSGKATSFYDKNTDQALAMPLVKILEQAQQEVPEWLLELAHEAPGSNHYGGNFGNFSSSDIRIRKEPGGVDNPLPVIDDDEEWD